MARLGSLTSNMIYLTVVNGKFAQRVQEHDDGAQRRELKNGKIVYERYYPSAEGTISKMEIRTHESNDGKSFESMCITLDGEIQIQLSGGINNPQNKDIINTLLTDGCDINRELAFIVGLDKKGYSRVFIMQDGHGLKRFSTKDNPNGVPQPTQKKSMGKNVWDWTEQDEWYYNKFQDLAKKIEGDNSDLKKKVENESEDSVDTDDIPF